MAAYTGITAKTQTLTISTVDSVTLTGTGGTIRIENQSATNPIYVTLGATPVASVTDPTAAGDNCYVVPPSSSRDFPRPQAAGTAGTVVKLISAGAQVYTVEVVEFGKL